MLYVFSIYHYNPFKKERETAHFWVMSNQLRNAALYDIFTHVPSTSVSFSLTFILWLTDRFGISKCSFKNQLENNSEFILNSPFHFSPLMTSSSSALCPMCRNRPGGHQSIWDASNLRNRHHQRLQRTEHGGHGPSHLRCGRGGLQTDGQVGARVPLCIRVCMLPKDVPCCSAPSLFQSSVFQVCGSGPSQK